MIKVAIGASVLVLATYSLAAAQNHTIVLSSTGDSTIYELDPVSGKVRNRLKTTTQPNEGAVTPDGKTIFVSFPSESNVMMIDGATFQERGRIESEFFKRPPQPRPPTADGKPRPPNTSASPHSVALTADGSKLYVGVENADVRGVVVYDVKSNKVIKKIETILTGGHFLSIQPSTGKLYYPNKEDNRVVVIDTKTDRILKVVPVTGGPRGVAFTATEAWVRQDNDGTVAVIDSAKDEVVHVVQTEGKGNGRIAVSPDGRYAASGYGVTRNVAIIDTQKRQVVAMVNLFTATTKQGPFNAFPLFSPDSSKLYVMNPPDGEVCVVDVKDWKIVQRHKVGVNPFGGGVRIIADRSTSQN
jgi:YVTN family beta-propeller protein